MNDRSLLQGCEPMVLEGGAKGVLVVHGFTSCPQSVKPLADTFAKAGFSVDVPLLPGHGTTVDDLATTGWADWAGAVEETCEKLALRCHQFVVAGLSMGGALALWLASRHPDIAGVVCVNPIVRISDDVREFARQTLEKGEDRIPAIAGDIADPEAQETGYEQTPLRPLLSLAEGVDGLRGELGKVTSPLLLLTSPQDHTVPPANSDEVAEAVQGTVQRITLERSYHVATLDYDRHLISAEAVAFARRVTTDQ